MARDKIPTSRVRRTARVGRAAAGQAVRQSGTHVANVARSEDSASRALEKRHLDAAEQIVAVLGTMKGAAMKLGQVMSFLDVGLVPEEYRDEFQRKLGELREAAPNVRFDDMRKVMEQEFEDPLEEVFASFEEEPIAAASIGQIFRRHPFIVVPDVVTRLSHERVVVTEFVEGTKFEELKTYPQPDRDRLGEIIFRFFMGCLYRHRQFSGDPHPGNFMLMEDGKVAFLDFGLFKRMEAEDVALELACQRATVEGDEQELHRLLAQSGFLPVPERVDPDVLYDYVRDSIWWYTIDEEVTLTPEIATEVMIEASDPRSSHFRQMRHQDMRPEHLFGRRMEMLTLAVLGQLRARNNWHRIAREWMYEDEPATELGRAEAAFYSRAVA